MTPNPAHELKETYHGFNIIGRREYPTMGDYERWEFSVYRDGNIHFRHSIKISRSQWVYLGKVSSVNEFLRSQGSARVRGKIDLGMYEVGEDTEYLIEDNPESVMDLSDEMIQLHILRALHRIRRWFSDRFTLESIDVNGFCMLLGIDRGQYVYNATYLRDKGYVADVPLEQRTLEQGGIYISDGGIDYLNSEEPKLAEIAGYRLHIDQIDSFEKVKSVDSQAVKGFLANGRFEKSENDIQLALERILDIPNHKQDWGGETNDLYTANLQLHGRRIPTAFLLKGNGLKKQTMEIADCGKNGDQLVRLFRSPAELFVVQFVGEISENVIADVEDKVKSRRSKGEAAYYCIIDGQDTARLLYAYDEL